MVLAAVVVAAMVLLGEQWWQGVQLRAERNLLRSGSAEQARLRAENLRLRARQLSPAELDALRADHAALERLRAELEALKPAP